jgi:hypothetical protein
MLVGLSPNTGPPIKFKSVAISSTCPRPVNIVASTTLPATAVYLTNDLRPISVPAHCKKPEIQLNYASVKVAG